MILAALDRYYHRLAERGVDIPPPGYSAEKISYALVLDHTGQLVDVISTQLPDAKGKLRPQVLSVPSLGKARASGIEPNFLWDKTSYVLGVSATSKRSADEHAAFNALHLAALADAEDEGLIALRHFLESWDAATFASHPTFAACREDLVDKNVIFRLDGSSPRWLHDRPAARALWTRLRSIDKGRNSVACLVTGQAGVSARLHPKVKGVDGAQSAGASVVSFNLDAFTSYGKEQGDNAPVSEAAAFGYTTALNHLLRRDGTNHQRLRIGDTTVVFWAEADAPQKAEAAESFLAGLLTPPAPTDASEATRLHDALESLRRGLPLPQLDASLDAATRMYVLGLAPSAARIAIRFWQTGSLHDFAQRLAWHFRDLELRPLPWTRAPSAWSLALATAPRPGDAKPAMKDVSPLLAGELMRAILSGRRYPQSLLANLVMRFRADGKLTPLRVALVKAVVVRNARLHPTPASIEGESLVSLDPGNTDPGYLLGRLFATLERIQYFALGGNANATIRDRYYGAASATPAGIFPVLLRNAQNHLGKLRKSKTGMAVKLDKQLGEIVDRLPGTFPNHLRLEEQGRFAIGYFHQHQHDLNGTKNDPSTPQGEDA